jgi:hypothetical protein
MYGGWLDSGPSLKSGWAPSQALALAKRVLVRSEVKRAPAGEPARADGLAQR